MMKMKKSMEIGSKQKKHQNHLKRHIQIHSQFLIPLLLKVDKWLEKDANDDEDESDSDKSCENNDEKHKYTIIIKNI